jgi:hypothetical protein
MNPRAFEPDLNCVSVINVAYDPTRFKHDPSHGAHSATPTTLRYFHAVYEDKNVIVVILVNLANGFFVTHGSTTRVPFGIPWRLKTLMGRIQGGDWGSGKSSLTFACGNRGGFRGPADLSRMIYWPTPE